MKQLFLSTLFVFFTLNSFAQEYSLELTKINSQKTTLIKDNSRVIVTTQNGMKYKGRIEFVDYNTLKINETHIALDDIKTLRKNQLFHSASYITLGSLGSLAGGVLVISLLMTQSSFVPVIAILGGTWTYIFASSLLRNNHEVKKWSYKILSDE